MIEEDSYDFDLDSYLLDTFTYEICDKFREVYNICDDYGYRETEKSRKGCDEIKDDTLKLMNKIIKLKIKQSIKINNVLDKLFDEENLIGIVCDYLE